MGKIFISYRRKESLAIASRIYERLEARFGAGSVFMDIDSIPPGVDFRAALSTGIATAAVVLAVIGEGWIDARDSLGQRRLDDPNDFVRIELEAAFERGVRIVPLLIGDAAMPHQNDLPESLRLLPFLNALLVDPGRNFNVHMGRLIGHLEEQAALSPARNIDLQGGLIRIFTVDSEVDCAALSPDGRIALSGGSKLRLWDTSSGQPIRELAGHAERTHSVAFSPDGRYVLSNTRKSSLALWEMSTGRLLRGLGSYSAAFSLDGRHILDCRGKLWETATGKLIREFGAAERDVFSPDAQLSLDGRFILLADRLKGRRAWGCTLWEVSTGRLIRSLAERSGTPEFVVFSPDGRHILARDSTGWSLSEIATGRLVREFHAGTSRGVLSPDGRFLLTVGGGPTLELWDVFTGQPTHKLAKNTDKGAFSPNGRFVLSVSGNQLELWAVATGRKIHTFVGHSGGVTSFVFSLDGQFALSGSRDHTLRLWHVAASYPEEAESQPSPLPETAPAPPLVGSSAQPHSWWRRTFG